MTVDGTVYRISAVVTPWRYGGTLIFQAREGWNWKEGQALVPLLATEFYNSKFWR
jgi:hypothetical protein